MFHLLVALLVAQIAAPSTPAVDDDFAVMWEEHCATAIAGTTYEHADVSMADVMRGDTPLFGAVMALMFPSPEHATDALEALPGAISQITGTDPDFPAVEEPQEVSFPRYGDVSHAWRLETTNADGSELVIDLFGMVKGSQLVAIVLFGINGSTESLVPFVDAIDEGWQGMSLQAAIPELSDIPIGWTMSEPTLSGLPGCE